MDKTEKWVYTRLMTEELDTSGLKCPLPVLKAKKALRGLESGETLRIVATDPSTVQDFPEFCGNAGHDLVESREADGSYEYLIRKG